MSRPWAAMWEAAARRDVLSRSARIALFVGTILAVVNHAPSLLALDVPAYEVGQILATYAVPFCVATWSAATQASAQPSRP